MTEEEEVVKESDGKIISKNCGSVCCLIIEGIEISERMA